MSIHFIAVAHSIQEHENKRVLSKKRGTTTDSDTKTNRERIEVMMPQIQDRIEKEIVSPSNDQRILRSN